MSGAKEIWNEKYREGSHTSLAPDPFLRWAHREYVQALLPSAGRVVDVAGGVGRHAIFYAKLGWRVTLTDVSEEGIALARKNALNNHVAIETIVTDLNSHDWTAWKEQFDLVLSLFYLQRELFPALEDVLKPGGLLIYKTYLRGGKSGLSHPSHLLQPDELRRAFSHLELLHYQERAGEKSVAEFVGRKPQFLRS